MASVEVPIRIGLVLKAVIGFAHIMECYQRRQALDGGFRQVIACSESGQASPQQSEAEQRFAHGAHIGAVVDQRMPFEG